MHALPLGDIRSILCLGAHADDIEIGAGGLMRTLVELGHRPLVRWVVFSASPDREAEARASAADFLAGAGATAIDVRRCTDGHFPSEMHAIKRMFEDLKADTSPDLVLTHTREDRHQDHRTISDLTWNTFRDHLILEYEIPKFDGDLGHPNLFVPIDDRRRAFKVQTLLRRYGSQRDKPWFSAETFEALLRLRGVECRSPTGYAEAFHGRKVPIVLESF